MRILRIELHGFRGFREYTEIDVPNGYLVIQGVNGAGKSTICDAIEFCITNAITKYPVEQAGKESVADYIWWRGEGTAQNHFVRIHFVGDGGKTFIITRTPDGCDKTEAEIISQLCNSQCPDNALQTLAETTLIRDESISALSLDISETDRYQRVQRALGAVLSRNLTERADRVNRKTEEIHKVNINREDMARKELNNALAQLSQARADVVEDKELKQAEADLRSVIPGAPVPTGEFIAFIRKWLATTQAQAENRLSLLNRLTALSAERAILQTPEFIAQLDAAETKVREDSKYIAATREELETAQKALALGREADAMAASLAELLAHGETIGLQEGHCPLCDSALSDTSFRAALDRGRERLGRRSKTAASDEGALAAATKKYQQAAITLELAERAAAGLRVRKESVEALSSQIEDLSQKVHLSDEEAHHQSPAEHIANVAREQSLFVEQRLRIVEGSRAFGQVRELEERIRTLRIEADKLANDVVRTQRATSAAKLIQHSITRTAGEMLDERLALISPLLSELFLRLKPHGDWRSIEYRIRGDVRRFLSLAVGGDLNPQFVFSSGQRRVTGLAFLLSVHLSRNWCNWRSLLLDDPVQHIDDYRALNLVEVLAAIRRDGRQIICAVEDVALANLLCRRLGTCEGQTGTLLTLEPGPLGIARVKAVEELRPAALRVLDRLPIAPSTEARN